MYHYFHRQTGATKARTLTIFAAIIITISAIIIAYSFKKSDPLEKKPSSTTSIPSGISNVPGEQTSEKYKELQLEENRLKAQEAKKEGVSAIPTLTDNRRTITPITDNTPQTCQSCCCAGGAFNSNDMQAALDLADKDPEAFKKLMLENPELARKLALQNPELFKKFIREDANFSKLFAKNNADALKSLMKNDPDFARTLANVNPDVMKTLITDDPRFAESLAEKNGDMLRKLMNNDPAFAKKLAQNNPALTGELKREGVRILDPAIAARLIGEVQKSPSNSLDLLKTNPGLAKALSEKDLSLLQKDDAHTKIFLNENPELAKALAQNDPAALKRLLLANPGLAAKLAHDNPELFKKLMEGDPAFMNAMSSSNPDLIKEFMKEDPAFAKKMAEVNPAFVKQALLNDPQLASAMQVQNPDLLKDLIKNDLEFSKKMAAANPATLKALLKDSSFAADMSKRNPSSLKSLMAGDPIFTRLMSDNNSDVVKSLLKLDPDFAKLMNERNNDSLRSIFEQDPQFAREFLANNPNIRINGLNRTTLAGGGTLAGGAFGQNNQQANAEKARTDRAKLEKQKQMDEAYKKGLDELTGNMQTQLSSAQKIWSDSSSLSYVAGKWAEPPKEDIGKGGAKGTSGAQGSTSPLGPPLIKAGTIVFAVIDTAINSDEPGPVLATIVGNSRLKGSKVIGEIKSSGTKAEKLTLNFSIMNMEEYPSTFGIKAVAVDPETSRTSLATDVDRHYLLRYGTLLASTFMTGYSKVITNQGTTNTSATNGGTTTTTTPTLTGKKEIFAALGDVGKGIGTAFADNVNRAYTVTIDAGTSVGLLFLGDVNEPQ
jgi:type IV secretory pathway VirB10-like protein